MIKNKIKVKCVQGFTVCNDKLTEGFEVLAQVFEGNEYEAELYSKTDEYFARDHEGREFLVGELKINSLGKPKIELGKEFELIEEEVSMSDKKERIANLIDILEIKLDYDRCYENDIETTKTKKGLLVKFDLCMFKNLSVYIPGMLSIDEYLIKDYIIKNLESLMI